MDQNSHNQLSKDLNDSKYGDSYHKSLAGDTGFIRMTSGAKEKEQQQLPLVINSSPSPWRNRLALSAVNRKVGGSSPPGDEYSYFYFFLLFFL